MTTAERRNDSQSTIAGLKAQDCPGGGWTGMPKEIEERGATVADCLNDGSCGCIYGDAVQHIERLIADAASPASGGETSSAECQQKRSAAWDIVEEAINTYDEWMLDDDYDGVAALHVIVKKMRERRELYMPGPSPSVTEELRKELDLTAFVLEDAATVLVNVSLAHKEVADVWMRKVANARAVLALVRGERGT